MASNKYKPRTKQQRKRKATGHAIDLAGPRSDTTEIVAEGVKRAERDARKTASKEAIRSEQNAQMSSKKKKRLDKYIENKLKKEQNVELLKKLAIHHTDTKTLKSSRNLGRISQRQRRADEGARDEGARDETISNSESEGNSGQGAGTVSVASLRTGTVQHTTANTPVSFGSGLKRSLERDPSGAPIIRKRQRMNATVKPALSKARSINEKPLWEDFNSTGSVKDPSRSVSDGDTEDEEIESGSGSMSATESGFGSDEDDDDDGEEADHLASSMFAALASVTQQDNAVNTNNSAKRNLSEFKAWATEQINEARDFKPSITTDLTQVKGDNQEPEAIKFTPRPPEQDELPLELRILDQDSNRKSHSVQVERTNDIQEARLKLPIVAEEQKIMEVIHNNPIAIVCGATGSGKTTQIPQFLFEAGYGDPTGPTPGMIAVTQPRRVAAVTMARRVAEELGKSGSKVAYQIRYGSTVSHETAIKFMTDGILIREIASDFALTRYSAIVIDEAHERSVNTDILIGMLSRITELRADMHKENSDVKPLKLIIMSATLMVQAFTQNSILFRRGTPPLVECEGRQYPVSMHFARRTERDYINEMFKKVLRGHKKLPPGSMLVFLTGENEIIRLQRLLGEALGGNASSISSARVRVAATDAPLETEDYDIQRRQDNFASEDEGDGDVGSGEGDEFDVPRNGGAPASHTSGALILPLYSKLPTKDQLRVFEPPPQGTRLIILATNVAETSITIPDIRYVFDCGRSKEKTFDQNTGVQSFEIGWISKASAAQRAGRAGRTSPGHCYRLYSSAVYERDFIEHTKPEILRMPVEGVVLQLKSMDLQHVVNFPFPTPPDRHAIAKAEKLLSYLGALDTSGKITQIGRDLSLYPLSPRYAKMLAIGHQQDCMLLTVATVAAMATPELFIPENQLDNERSVEVGDHPGHAQMIESTAREERRKAYNNAHHTFSSLDKHSDALKLLSAFGAYTFGIRKEDPDAFCNRVFLQSKPAKEALQLFQQLLRIVADNRPGLVDPSISAIPRATDKQIKALKQIVAVGFIDQVAIRADLAPLPPDLPKAKRATDVPYLTLFPSHEGRADTEAEKAVYVHASSVLAHCSLADMPPYLIYSQLQRGNAAMITGCRPPKVRMHPLTSVTAAQLSALAKGTPLLQYGKPIGKIEVVAGEADKRVCWVVPSLVGQRGTAGWPLPAQKVVQKRGTKGTWEVVRVAT